MVFMDMRFMMAAFIALFSSVGYASKNKVLPAANRPTAGGANQTVFQTTDEFKLKPNEVPAGYAWDMEAFSNADAVKASPGADYLGLGMPLRRSTYVYLDKRERLFSSAPTVTAFKNEMKRNGISQEPDSSVSDEIRRLPPHGWTTFALGKSAYLVSYENGRLNAYANGNRHGFAVRVTLYPAENASQLGQKKAEYVDSLKAGEHPRVSGIERLQSPGGAITYLLKGDPNHPAVFRADYATGNALVEIIVGTDPENPDPSDRALAISIARLVASKSKANNPA
jgi:hypothetical protein